MSPAAGDMSDLLSLLARLAGERATGIVTALRGNHKRLFCLEKGLLIHAVSNVVEEQWSEALVRAGALSPEEIEQAQQESQDGSQPLATNLLQRCAVNHERLGEIAREHVLELLSSTLEWDNADYTFDKGKPDLEGELTVEISCAGLVLQRLQDHPLPIDHVRSALGHGATLPITVPPTARWIGSSVATELSGYLLESCDGERELAALISGSPADEEKTLRMLHGLTLLGAVRLLPEKLAADGGPAVTKEECEKRLAEAEHSTHYQILGVAPTSATNEIRESYFSLARRLHPDRFRSGELQDLRTRMEDYFSRVTEAYNTLFDEKLRQEYDQQLSAKTERKTDEPEKDAAYLGRENFARAKLLINRRRFQEAVTFLENATKLDPNNPRYAMELGRVLIRNPRRRKEAEQLLLRSLEMDPTRVETLIALGQLQLKSGRAEQAAKRFREALRWEPDNVEAMSLLQQLEKQGTDGGILKGLFKS